MVCKRITPHSYASLLVISRFWGHRVFMRIASSLILMSAAFATVPIWAGDAFGFWKVNLAASTFPRYGEKFSVRFEPHSKGEVFTLDRVDHDGRSTTSSTILYLDSKPRNFQDFGCSGTQSSKRVDSRTVEIIRACDSGERTRFVRRLSANPKELVLEITEEQPDGSRLERRLVLERFLAAVR